MRRPIDRITLGLLSALLCALPEARGDICEGISPASHAPLTTVRLTTGLVRPLFLTAPPGDTERLFIIEQDGRIRIFKDGALQAGSFLDVSALTRSPSDGGGNEEGLLGLAFDPDYAGTGRFFVYHTNTTGGTNVIARYTRSAGDPDVADAGSRQTVISFSHPTWDNHNGGMIGFGPDGYLYVATGDGGGSCDSETNAQDPLSLLGKLLRIDVSTLPYLIPPGNPFGPASDPGGLVRDEIWQMGLRNPWRWSFAGPLAPSPGELYLGDVGQGQVEEIDYLPPGDPGGDNLGWPLYEGDNCPNPSCGSPTCSVPGYVPPIHEYSSAGGLNCAVTGGYAYAGCRMPGLRGTYFYADFCSASIASFVVAVGGATSHALRTAELAPGGGLTIRDITSFGEDPRGEIYIIDRGSAILATGEVYKIVPILPNLEVSGGGADPFLLDGSAWTWEDLFRTSSHPIAAYRVFRHDGNGGGTFVCVHEGAAPEWPGGDPGVPPPGGIHSFLVTAVNAAGQRTSPGTGSAGTPRALSADPCP